MHENFSKKKFSSQNCAEQPFDTDEIFVSRNSKLQTEFSHAIKNLLTKVEKNLGEPGETIERHTLVGVVGLAVLYMFIYRDVDKKWFKQIWDSYKKVLKSQFFFMNHS